MSAKLSAHDRVRIAAKAIVSPRTVARVYGGSGTEYSRARVLAAAHALGLPAPRQHDSSSTSEPAPPEGGGMAA